MESKKLIFEACVETLEEALAAESRGVNRIELCSSLDQDGLTSSHELTMHCLKYLSVPIMAMIRPRGGNFVYTEDELRQMETEIDFFKRVRVAGVVFGILSADHSINLETTSRLVTLASPLEVTFHKAIDYSNDVFKSFQEVNEIEGITRVLTSGGKDTAWDGRFVLQKMQESPNRQIQIIAAGKVLPENRIQIAEFTGVAELHGRHIV